MSKQVTIEAETVEAAREQAAQQLGVAEEALTFEVLQEPQKKKLGLFGGVPAIVKATLAQPDGAPAEKAREYLQNVLTQMGAQDITVEVEEKEGGCTLKLNGEHVSFIIGRRGETLDALQYLTGLAANHCAEGYYRVNIDVGDYREKRAAVLVNLANKTARQVLKTTRKSSLEPMNPYERRIIHTAIQEIEGVTSWSVGSDDRRHVIIAPEGMQPQEGAEEEAPASRPRGGRGGRGRRGGRGNGRGNGNGQQGGGRGERRERGQYADRAGVAQDRPARQVREFIPRSNPLPTAEDAAPVNRTESEAEKKATLYGRIDL